MRRALLAGLALCLATAAQAQDYPAHTGKVNDFAAVLAAADRDDLERRLAELERATSAEVAVVTMPTLNGRPLEEYATGLFNAWGIGKQDRDNGVLVLVAVDDRAMRIEVGYGLEGVMPDGLAGAIIRETFLPKFRDGDFRGGLLDGTARVIEIVRRNETLTPAQLAALDAAAREAGKSWGFAAFLGLFVGIGAFTGGTAAGARVIVQMLFGLCFTVGAFRDSGLIEAFESATVQHVLTGDAGGVPFAVAELALLDAKQYRMFSGVLASFALARPRPALTVVTRDRGLLGNLVAGAGGALETLTLEDPAFEALFEVYGDDQVEGRVILTTTMLERLKALDELGHARGFACAFRGRHLLIAFDGMDWRCPPWRILRPLDGWLADYAAWLTGLVDLPRAIVTTLNLLPPGDARRLAHAAAAERFDAISISTGTPEVFSTSLFRIIGEGGMGAVYVMSGAVFGGLALVAARYGVTEGFSPQGFWYWWGLTAAGLGYGAFAIGLGLRQIVRLVWKWKSPLRTMGRR